MLRVAGSKKAQSILEYGLLIAIMAAAFGAMNVYAKRAVQNGLKAGFDGLGSQTEPAPLKTTFASTQDTTESQGPNKVEVLVTRGGTSVSRQSRSRSVSTGTANASLLLYKDDGDIDDGDIPIGPGDSILIPVY